MSETEIMRDILCAITAVPGALFWRQNTGVFRSLSGREVVRCGIPGMADIGGVYLGRSIQIEVKTAIGRLSKEQKRWKAAVERAGGVFVCARNPTDALTVLAALDAQSGWLPTHSEDKQPASEKLAGNGEAVS
jgi:hypothetical protein